MDGGLRVGGMGVNVRVGVRVSVGAGLVSVRLDVTMSVGTTVGDDVEVGVTVCTSIIG